MKLYIIGNGFDIHHLLDTRYRDYKNFMIANKYLATWEISDFELGDYRNGELKKDDWSNIEEALSYNFSEMCNQAYLNYPVDLTDDSDSRWDNMVIECERLLSIPSKIIGKHFTEWILSVDVKNIKNKIQLDKNAYFLTFNYTKTLEVGYGIYDKQILHIHGLIGSRIQFGNNENNPIEVRNNLDKQYSGEEWYGATYSRGIDVFEKYCCESYKDLANNVRLLNEWLANKVVDEIVIYGHKITGVDSFYYENYLFKKYSKIKWTVYYHNEDEKDEFINFFKKHKVVATFLNW